MYVTEASVHHWLNLTASLQSSISNLQSPIIYAVGGGLAVDAAKYIANGLNLPLTCLPTALSVDAFLTWASGVRHEGCVQYMETKSPERLIVDMDVLAVAPEPIRAAGICDVLSIATGLWDWELAAEKGKNPEGMELIPWVADAAQAILDGALECAEAAGAGDDDGLKATSRLPGPGSTTLQPDWTFSSGRGQRTLFCLFDRKSHRERFSTW